VGPRTGLDVVESSAREYGNSVVLIVRAINETRARSCDLYAEFLGVFGFSIRCLNV
jgi:hypothetical protein